MARELIQKESEGANGWTVWQVFGRVDTQTARQASEKGTEIVNRCEKTVLDAAGVDYLSSAGLRVLLQLNKLASKSGKKFVVANPTEMVRAVIEDSGMDALLTMKTSLDELE